MSPTTLAKAARINADGRVKLLSDARVFAVEGDTGHYAVTVVRGVAICSCPATLACSHTIAALAESDALDQHLRTVAA